MKNLFFALPLAALMTACCSDCGMSVKVENTSSSDRTLETVELAWSDVTAKLADVTADDVIVLLDGTQIPSQVMFIAGDSTKPASLIFQATVAAGESTSYKIAKGEKEEYEQQAFSRFVPERMDDYAWENNVIAQRVYGKILENELKTSGVDVWSKTVPSLVIDKWYSIGHYHEDIGEGMDCYKVGTTMGAGSSAPMFEDQIVLSGNMIGWTRTANGPIRTEFTLTYEPIMVGETAVNMVKTYSLDANTRFSKVVDIFTGAFDKMDVAVGCVVHTADAPQFADDEVYALYEPASDDQHNSGFQIAVGVIAPGSVDGALAIGDHKVKKVSVSNGVPNVYYVGSGCSEGGLPTAQSWFDYVEQAADAIEEPLTVTIE